MSAARRHNLIVTGQVPDVRPCFDAVKLSIAPIVTGLELGAKINQSMFRRAG